jgi:uncharacterized protein YbjQ (UPF0145 family)
MATALALPGFRIVVVRSRSVFCTLGTSLQTLVGVTLPCSQTLCERTRQDSFVRMKMQAEAIGANGVIALRYDANEVMQV